MRGRYNTTDLVRADRIIKAMICYGVTVCSLSVKFLFRQLCLLSFHVLDGSLWDLGHNGVWNMDTCEGWKDTQGIPSSEDLLIGISTSTHGWYIKKNLCSFVLLAGGLGLLTESVSELPGKKKDIKYRKVSYHIILAILLSIVRHLAKLKVWLSFNKNLIPKITLRSQ